MNECALAGSNIISMSLGGPSASRAEREAVEALRDSGILLIAAAGNSGNLNNPLEFPSGYDAVMSVAAVDEDSQITLFSSHNRAVDIAAPGLDVESLKTGGGETLKNGKWNLVGVLVCQYVSVCM
jgi:serine protease